MTRPTGQHGQFFPLLEKVLKEYGEPMHYTDLAKLVEIPEKNVCTALAHHTRHHPLGTVRRVKRGTYLYVGSAHAQRRRNQNIADVISNAPTHVTPELPKRVPAQPLPVDQPRLFGSNVPVYPPTEQLRSFGDELTPTERAAFREAAELAQGYAPKNVVDPGPRTPVSMRDAVRPGARITITVSHHQFNQDDRGDGAYEMYFVLNGRMWKAREL